jgi:hypothetical protein
MTIVFETAGGQQLKAKVSGKDWTDFVEKLNWMFHTMRMTSVKKEHVGADIESRLQDYVLIAREAPMDR